MPLYPPDHDNLTQALAQFLPSKARGIVAITGKLGAGKTTLARYFAWHFNVSLLETDWFLCNPTPPPFRYRDHDSIRRIIHQRTAMSRPIIVEGVAVLELMKDLGYAPDAIVHVTSAWQKTPVFKKSA